MENIQDIIQGQANPNTLNKNISYKLKKQGLPLRYTIHLPALFSSDITVWQRASNLRNSCTLGSPNLMHSFRWWSKNWNVLSTRRLTGKSTGSFFCRRMTTKRTIDLIPTIIFENSKTFSLSIFNVYMIFWPQISDIKIAFCFFITIKYSLLISELRSKAVTLPKAYEEEKYPVAIKILKYYCNSKIQRSPED